jgi:hypothetical protein
MQLAAASGSVIMSVRAWHGVVTAGVTGRSGAARTEVVIDAQTGTVLQRYPATPFGGAVAASTQATVVIGADTVTSYDNVTGKIRWQRRTDAGQTWRADGDTLYVTQSGGSLGAAPITGLAVIDLSSGTERSLDSPVGSSFAGTLAGAIDGVVLFTSASGVTAYSGSTGGVLWSFPNAVPEGTDPLAVLVYLTAGNGSLIGVNPSTGKVVSTVSGSATTGSAGMYVVRGGEALGLDTGAGGDAWGYNVAVDRVTWTAGGLPWPHYFSDLSGLGGSASLSGDVVVITACPHLAPASASSAAASPSTSPSVSPSTSPSTSAGATSHSATSPSATVTPAATASASPTDSPSPTPSPTPSAAPVQVCADPELVALNV